MKKLLSSLILLAYFFNTQGGEIETEAPITGFDLDDKNLTFRIFTRQTKNDGFVLYIGNKKRLMESGFKGTLPTKLFTHGYLSNSKAYYIDKLKEELLKVEETNFITLDWSCCTKNVLYEQVVECMKKVGYYTAKFLKFLMTEGNLQVDKTHLIGHSLGAHLLGEASRVLKSPKPIARITGLDPAGPLFEHADESDRLNPKSADFVDVIHTCRIFTGIEKPIGTADFYPNGGYFQPGCNNFDMACHHRTSFLYFIDSINEKQKKKYTGRKCETVKNAINGTCFGDSAVMGYHAVKSSPGIYYLKITEY